MEINIRQARSEDSNDILKLLIQVNDIHADGRPDLFKKGKTKYSSDDLIKIFENPNTPVFVAADEDNRVVGYCFCVMQRQDDAHNMKPLRTLYIDDLCVDDSCRGLHVGKRLFEYVKNFAKSLGCYNVTLNVWACNARAMSFYQKIGMEPYKIGMEAIL